MIRAAQLLALVGLSFALSVIFVSDCQACIVLVDNLSAKILLIASISLMIAVLLLQIYFSLFIGGALRTTKSCIHFCKMGLTASVSVPWTLYVAGRFSGEPELRLLVSFTDAGYASVFSLAASLVALYYFNERYIYLCRPVNRRWAEID